MRKVTSPINEREQGNDRESNSVTEHHGHISMKKSSKINEDHDEIDNGKGKKDPVSSQGQKGTNHEKGSSSESSFSESDSGSESELEKERKRRAARRRYDSGSDREEKDVKDDKCRKTSQMDEEKHRNQGVNIETKKFTKNPNDEELEKSEEQRRDFKTRNNYQEPGRNDRDRNYRDSRDHYQRREDYRDHYQRRDDYRDHYQRRDDYRDRYKRRDDSFERSRTGSYNRDREDQRDRRSESYEYNRRNEENDHEQTVKDHRDRSEDVDDERKRKRDEPETMERSEMKKLKNNDDTYSPSHDE